MLDAYPVSVRGELDPHTNRFMFLVKWLLIIPHVLILYVLGAVDFIIYLIAYVAILFTGRFPRGLFDFSLNIMRWEWRVIFYSYGLLGTDRYPPLSMADDADRDYPAGLTVEYPDRLSRLLLLLKCPLIIWIVLLPHLIILWALGIVSVFVLLVVILAKLFTGSYPQGLFEFLLGVNRWGIRVNAYRGLMTDRYPPFRLSE